MEPNVSSIAETSTEKQITSAVSQRKSLWTALWVLVALVAVLIIMVTLSIVTPFFKPVPLSSNSNGTIGNNIDKRKRKSGGCGCGGSAKQRQPRNFNRKETKTTVISANDNNNNTGSIQEGKPSSRNEQTSLLPPPLNPVFNQETALRMADVANAAYYAYFQTEQMNQWLTYSNLYIYNLEQFYSVDTEIVGFVANMANDETLLIAFTGTQAVDLPLTVIEDDLSIGMVDFPPLSGSKVSQGFLRSWESVKPSVWNRISSPKIQTVWLSSHSLGAAIATLASAEIKSTFSLTSTRNGTGRGSDSSPKRKNMDVITYTFASPRVGDVRFAQEYDMLGIISNRIQNKYDIIPRLPLRVGMGYRHVKTLILLISSDNATNIDSNNRAQSSSEVQDNQKTNNDKRISTNEPKSGSQCIYDAKSPTNILDDPLEWPKQHALGTYMQLISDCTTTTM